MVNDPSPLQQGSDGKSLAAGRTESLSDFERKTQALVAADSDEGFRILLLSFKEDEPLAQRGPVLAALQGASPAVLPLLMTALTDDDPGVRAGAAQVLGMRRDDQAIAALAAATYDANSTVRLQAVQSLDALDAWQVLPRFEHLSISEGFGDVREAASTAKENLRRRIAAEIGISALQVRDISVAPADPPRIYAVTESYLYARHGTRWELASRLPDASLAIAAGKDPTLVYLVTVRGGLYRSLDSGETWKHMQVGLQTPAQLTVTALALDPQDSRRVYIALAAQSAKPGVKVPLGLFASQDGGGTWIPLPGSPSRVITTRLVTDPQSEGYLFGMIEDTPWRYTLSSSESDLP